ncbi:DUF4114 domain-containing protein [Arcticibacterium luteifluviistationis]|uniref:DUF4114 domain-containing protein n=1 Tax=Arcticibacterium luteifluviistationis TaxID=1784714 RepID=A0A2Z4GH01_9BACT|nr:DUF4114 domain-containing protein [Arcticibacterium luteifluviistationis]AWW00472.1 hypothetical protein DJ013_20735 [Arcticibacterium luteifluviistationis]
MKVVFKVSFFLFQLLSIIGFGQNYSYMGTYNSNGVPNYLTTSDVVSQAFLNKVDASLPESYPVPFYNSHYIATGTESNIVLIDSADIWITFVAEGAGYKNALGYYTFDASNPSATAPAAEDINIIFPNVSRLYSGGGLLPGNKVHLGSFAAGTGIGWVLIANGWDSGKQLVENKQWTVYSNPAYNPEAVQSLKYHNVQLIDEETERIVLGFEDIRRDYASCDQDFNDAIFYISANPIESISLSNINYTSPVEGAISSGNQGGLESNGSLAEKIAKRNLEKDLLNKDENRYQSISMSSHAQVKGIFSTLEEIPLTALVPGVGPDSSDAFQSTPTDLLDLTNAIEVLSVDFFDSTSNREAVCLVTKTIGEVYSHTKSICDRVGGAELLGAKTVMIGGEYPGTLISLKRGDGAVEYAMSFSLKELGDDQYQFNSHWNITDYPSGGVFLNFQLWGRKPSDVFYLAEQVINIFSESFALSKTASFSESPAIAMRFGEYIQGEFKLTLINSKRETGKVFVEGTLRNSEQTNSIMFKDSVELTGSFLQEITFDTPGVFDAGLNIHKDGSSEIDAIYLADGAWIANFEEANVANVNLSIFPLDKIVENDNHYWIERSFEASGDVKNYYSVHRPLRLGLRAVDLTQYSYLSFVAEGVQSIEIVLSHEGVTEWLDQPRKVINLTSTASRFYIPLSEFLDASSGTLSNYDITALTFSAIGDNASFAPFDFKFNNISFSKVNGCENDTEIMATSYSNEVYASTGNMQVTSKAKDASRVVFTSENSIEFKPGFSTESGSVINAQILGCQN